MLCLSTNVFPNDGTIPLSLGVTGQKLFGIHWRKRSPELYDVVRIYIYILFYAKIYTLTTDCIRAEFHGKALRDHKTSTRAISTACLRNGTSAAKIIYVSRQSLYSSVVFIFPTGILSSTIFVMAILIFTFLSNGRSQLFYVFL